MHQAADVQFERAVHEFSRWRAVPEQARSPAPAWWWGTAFELRDVCPSDETTPLGRADYQPARTVPLNLIEHGIELGERFLRQGIGA